MPAPAPGTSSNYQLPRTIPQLDRLRGLAILFVLFRHCAGIVPAWLHGFAQQGWAGVDLFFVLSGFLITGILWDTREGKKYFARFYGRRLLRIWPVYLVMLSLVFLILPLAKLIVGGPALKIPKDPLRPWIYLLMIQNLFAKALNGSFALITTWSLAVEEQFYIVWPAVIRFISRHAALPCLLAGIFLAPFLRMWAMHRGMSQVAIYENPLTHGDGLLCGAAVAIGLRSAKTTRRTLLLTGLALLLSGLVLFLLVLPPDIGNQYISPFVFTSVALASTGLLLVALVSENAGRFVHRAFFMNRTLAFFGFISYGLYLYHLAILRLAASDTMAARLDWFHNPYLARDLLVVFSLGLSVLIAWISRITLEKAALSKKGIFG